MNRPTPRAFVGFGAPAAQTEAPAALAPESPTTGPAMPGGFFWSAFTQTTNPNPRVSTPATAPLEVSPSPATLDAAAFAKTYDRHRDRFAAYALSLTGQQSAADDLLQDASLRMFVKRDQYTPGTHFAAWGRRIVYTSFLTQRRRTGRRRERQRRAEQRAGWGFAKPVANAGLDDLVRSEIQLAVASLSPVLRESFELKAAGFTHEEIADRLMVPAGTIKSRVFHARRQLRGKLHHVYRAELAS